MLTKQSEVIMMPFKKYDKLVRDNIIQIIEDGGNKASYHIVEGEEYKKYLIKKLQEEFEEFVEKPIIEELADIKEVIDALQTLDEYKNLDTVKINKANENGKFEKRIVLTKVESF